MKYPAFLGKILYFVTKPVIRFILRGSTRSYVVIQYQDSVIVTKNWLGRQDKWRLPGGGAKKHEDSKKTATREVYEELGIYIDTNKLKPLGAGSFKAKEKFDYYLYEVKLDNKPILNINQKEILQAKFIKISDIKNLSLGKELQIAISFLT